MKKLIFISIFLLFSSNLLLAQVTADQSYAQKSSQSLPKIALKSEEGEVQTFDINKGEAVVKIKWGADRLNYQLIYKRAPMILKHYINDLHPNSSIAVISFLDKDGFTITQRSCYANSFLYEDDGKTLVCRNLMSEDLIYSNTTIDDYYKISGAAVSINQGAI